MAVRDGWDLDEDPTWGWIIHNNIMSHPGTPIASSTISIQND
jgi:hypothetical protein